MNILNVINRFQTQDSCIDHLESIRYKDDAYCPHCGSIDVARKADGQRVGRWNCHDCQASFNVLSGTIFQGTHLPLQKWFCAIAIIVNAKKSLSSHQLSRDLSISQSSAWYMQQRIRSEMVTKQGRILLKGIIEADETYVGGKPRNRNRKPEKPPENGDGKTSPKNKRGRGTKKTAVIGAVERGGNVVARVANDLSGKGVLAFIQGAIDPNSSTLVTDEYKSYNVVRRIMNHAVIHHSKHYSDGAIHTNTIEGVWSLLKRAWYGSHHHYTKRYTPLYVAEACYKYNHRKDTHAFDSFMTGCFA